MSNKCCVEDNEDACYSGNIQKGCQPQDYASPEQQNLLL